MTSAKCFVAYPEKPLDRGESIELFISNVNGCASDYVNMVGWKTLNNTGKEIISEICKSIDDCDIFICDLTILNRNVLFELGYAISRNKRIWITLDTSLDESVKNYKKLGLLSTIAYSAYQNSVDLTRNFFIEQPYLDLESTIYKRIFENLESQYQDRKPFLFYLKSEVNTDASIELNRSLKESKIRLVVDDNKEISGQPLIWYAQNVYSSFGVIAHFISEDREENIGLIQNSKYSIISGIAFGLGKPLLMLAHSPFNSPIDFRDLLYIHETASELKAKLETWLPWVKNKFFTIDEEGQERKTNLALMADLQKINIGEYVAENEEQQLSDYFVTTASYFQALKAEKYLIYIGRKGSGKTANLFQIAKQLELDKRNLVCIIKPIDYELEGVLRLLSSNITKADPGYLIESLWKFLIYTELANLVYSNINNKPSYIDSTEKEKNLITFIENNQPFIKQDFTWRMEYAIDNLCGLNLQFNIREQRAKVSEILHIKILGELRELLGNILETKNKVIILIDNLDKAWEKGENIKLLTDFLFGLLSCGQTIADEFNKQKMRFAPVHLSLIIFLRSDIFSYVKSNARESDKLNFTRMDWNDHQLLQRIIEERFLSSSTEIDIDNIWEKYFVSKINNLPIKEYLVSRIIPRPRDLIFLCKNALNNAVNHKNKKIEEKDILQAEDSYSELAFSSLLAETETQFDGIEDFLYEFAGGKEIISRNEIQELLEKVKIPKSNVDSIIDLLIDSTFLGLETDINSFEFVYDESRKKVIQKLAKRVTEETGFERYKINVPFHAYLEIRNNPA
ncbi:MAG TPA: hypothetical protein VKF38_08240 [Anaerolineaceae bacterium]|nr:hypothetical protein [Anaerolineaceae bacterium]